jgi:DNA-directed RNA polymerase specialized sigma24 family protein
VKAVRAAVLTYDAAIGRVEPGQVYVVEDDKAERWVTAGVATVSETPPPTPPVPEPEPIPPQQPAVPADDEEDEDEEEEEDAEAPPQLREQVHTLHDQGDSERTIAQKLGISRPRVHALLMR